MSWNDSRAAQRLRAASQLSVPPPPALKEVRRSAARNKRKAYRTLIAVLAVPLGTFAAVGGHNWFVQKQLREEAAAASATRSRSPVARAGHKETSALAVEALEAKASAPVEPIAQRPTMPVSPRESLTTAEPGNATRAVSAATLPAPSKKPSGELSQKRAGTLKVEPPEPTPASPPPMLKVERPVKVTDTPDVPRTERSRAPAAATVERSNPAENAPPPSSALSQETAMLAEALASLRGKHAPASALALIGRYREAHPQGALRDEASLLAVEAHRALGESAKALAELGALRGRLDFDVLRAELNAELGRCEAARQIVASLHVEGELRERALFTDATCALVLGRREEALEKLKALPDSERARALLEKIR